LVKLLLFGFLKRDDDKKWKTFSTTKH